MEITRNTPEQLIVENNPVWVAALLVVMGLIILGTGIALTIALPDDVFGLTFGASSLFPFGMLFIFARRTQLILDANKSSVTQKLAEIDCADLESSRTNRSNRLSVTLVTTGKSTGRHPLTLFYSNISNHRGLKGAINARLTQMRGT